MDKGRAVIPYTALIVRDDSSISVKPSAKTMTSNSNPGRPANRANDTDRHVGARIRERRIMLGLSQQQMADLIGVTYQQAHKYERGINRISAGRLHEISLVLGVPHN